MAVSFRALRLTLQTALALSVAPVLADDWVIAFPAPAVGSAQVEKRYGAVTYTGTDSATCPTCLTNISVRRDSGHTFLRVMDTSNSSFSWAPAFSLPLDPIWSWNHDLRSAKRIRVHMRKLPGFGISDFDLEGPATPFSSGGKDMESSLYKATSSWSWINLPFDAFGPSLASCRPKLSVPDSLGNIVRWNIPSGVDPERRMWSAWAINTAMRDTGFQVSLADAPFDTTADYLFDDDSNNVLKHVRDFKISIQGGFGSSLFGFDLDSIVIENIKPQWGRIRGRTCAGERILVDRFDENRAPGLSNRLAGSWSVTTDTSSNLPAQSRGHSALDADSDAWGPSRGAYLSARLARDSAWSRPDAGWARLSTTLAYGGGTANFSGLKAISFRIQAGQGANTLFDSAKVRGVTLRLHSPDVPDSVTYFLRIPYDSIRPLPGDSGRDICVELDELRQASWYTGKAGIHVIDPSKLSAISWTLALEDQGAVSAAPSSISIREVSLWKPISVGARGRVATAPALAVRAGRIEVRAPWGSESFLEIRRMDGSLASRTRIAPAGGLVQVPVPRERGVFAAELRSTDGSRNSTSFAIP